MTGPALKYYKTQQDTYSCGPVALYNFLVWAKLRPKLSDLAFLKKLLHTRPNHGTDFDLVLNFMSFFSLTHDINVYNTRSITKVMTALHAGGSFLMVFDGGDGLAHITFCRGIIDGKISLINAVKGKKDLRITKQQFKNMCLNNSVSPIFITMREL